MEFDTCNDETKQYLDACYVRSCKAHWCLYLFDMQEHNPPVICLQVHLPDYQPVVISPEQDENIQDVLDSNRNHDTTLTAWFKANAELDLEEVHNLLYQDFPSMMVWNKKDYKWTVRKEGFSMGRMYHAHLPHPLMTFAPTRMSSIHLSRRPV